jgi:hypothetical protein
LKLALLSGGQLVLLKAANCSHQSREIRSNPQIGRFVIRRLPDWNQRMKNEFTSVIERDGDWYIGYCPEVPAQMVRAVPKTRHAKAWLSGE